MPSKEDTVLILELIICAVLFFLGLTYTFWGYKNLKKLISIGSAIIAFICAFSITMEFGLVPALIISTVVAVIIAILSHFFFNVGIFLIGACLGLMVAAAINAMLPLESLILDIVILTFFFVLFGILAIKSKRVFLAASTAFTGAAVCITSLAMIITAIASDFPDVETVIATVEQHSLFVGIGAAVLGLIGFIIQLSLTAPDKRK